MNGLLQRLVGQALGASGPRIRSAAAVHAQVPIALPSGRERDASDGARAFDGAASPTTVAPMTATSPNPGADSMREPADAAAERNTRKAEDRQPIDEGTPRQIDADAEPVPVTLFAIPSVPAPLLGDLAAPAPPAAGSIRPAVAHQPKAGSDQEPTEVHVHIGRIEVTALPAAAATPKRRPERQSAPLSDYLGKRRSS